MDRCHRAQRLLYDLEQEIPVYGNSLSKLAADFRFVQEGSPCLKMFVGSRCRSALGASTSGQSRRANPRLANPFVWPNPRRAGFDGKSGGKDVKVLADDKLEGRETGSPDFTALKEYVVDHSSLSG